MFAKPINVGDIHRGIGALENLVRSRLSKERECFTFCTIADVGTMLMEERTMNAKTNLSTFFVRKKCVEYLGKK